ncbi:PREDICTED: fetuin-B isoform X2 [Chinchilla lanigera]|uniref:Fetuin B n=2 Tax=Chinchilla lanigera TaxID=34839 RepID=A0A8C2W3J8_CHILA|nr:PREDICTED: fetuin-B isoform X2 [Chinchilla lanigera]XP_005383329.1 PREDICTED: fetuin-B isoform X2 [Chinchilla lanigera]XP_005383330.1 PREDICTED: fetuin-B isoform X2 [Chinchilla lanigera]
MHLLLSLGLCALAQATCCGAQSPPQQALGSSPLLSRGCSDSDVLAVSGMALQDINRDQQEGYALGLNRVHGVWEHRQDSQGSLFYLTLDVLETSCHVLSRKDWKDCGARLLHESVYGQCKAMFYVNKPKRILYLPAYNCTLRPVSRRKIHMMCPDCPSPSSTDLSDPRVLEAATESLAKYNSKSASKQYSLDKVTRASHQWVVGPAYFVEYLIRESPCTKLHASSCSLQSSDSMPVGLCQGSLTQTRTEKFVSVTCDFFKSQVQTPEGESSAVKQSSGSLPGVEQPLQENTTSSSSPAKTGPLGSIQHLPDLEDETPKGSEEKDRQEAFPVQLDLTTNPQGDTLDISFLFLGSQQEKLVVLPFPKERHSAECPGPARTTSPLVLPA